jgi:hypothetical protein
MNHFLREVFGSAWPYYFAMASLFVWWLIQRSVGK